MLKKVVGSNMGEGVRGQGQISKHRGSRSKRESEVMVRINGCGVGMKYIEEELVN